MSVITKPRNIFLLTSIASACMLTACGGGDDSPSTSAGSAQQEQTLSGVVVAAGYVPGNTTGNPTIKAGYYSGATVCLDANGDGACDSASTTTDANGRFTLKTTGTGQLIADVGTKAKNTANGQAVASHMILRASSAQIADQGATSVVISPMSSEVQRLVEANGTSYATEKSNLASRMSAPALGASSVAVNASNVLGDVNALSGAAQQSILFEDNQLANRYTYATTKFDRHDLYPDNLAVPGGDPSLVGLTNVSTATAVVPAKRQTQITFAQSQQAAFNIEGIPRYDNIFIVMLENKSTNTILGSQFAPNINALLAANNNFTTYYATGNPSEPNYTALGGADDWGITDDNWWGCGAGAPGSGVNNAPTDALFPGGTASDGAPLVATTGITPPLDTAHLSNVGTATCNVGTAANHNVSAPSLFTLISQAGMNWRTYSESMNPGQDPRSDSIADAAVSDTYTGPGSVGTAFAVPNGLYKTKHHPGMAYQTTRDLPEFYADNRTVFGTQYTAADWAKSTAYTIPTGYNYDQLSTDLATGDVGNINFIMPDQCDDMHGVGNDTSCKNTNLIQRGDAYVKLIVDKIQASPLWTNRQRKVAIVVMFDEGGGSSTSCCGWNTSKTSGDQPLQQNADGTFSPVAAPLLKYGNGNFGHGNSIFGMLTNQQTATQGVTDSDSYSHFSLVRTLQDMFQIADPQQPATYLARAKYTESFIAQNILNLPEFASSADTHFDSVRPMNHAYVIPAAYTQRLNPGDVSGTSLATAQVGPDASQTNAWTQK
ncbi:alkaline phosphatase family protein [Paraburkholderia sp. SOS3]|uniref:alkaline phosphatase family protein n=1 Tax=Paraburkholderia sp. SOS3 TaxID=1926494 RepID=UPI0009476DB4|nr:alkaline phosphatase family protein [Paraburkholderia sp. SOS3]APR38521.1 phosphoesterase [Paraburkholderia sp. SOS3]